MILVVIQALQYPMLEAGRKNQEGMLLVPRIPDPGYLDTLGASARSCVKILYTQHEILNPQPQPQTTLTLQTEKPLNLARHLPLDPKPRPASEAIIA